MAGGLVTQHGAKALGDGSAGWIGPTALVLSVLLLGSNWPVLKIALRGTTPLWFSSARLLSAGALYALLLAVQRRLIWPPRGEWPIIVVLGAFQSALMMGLLTVGVGIVGAGRSAILAYTMPIWMIPGAALLLHERASRAQLVGLLFGVIGIVALFNPLEFDWSDRRVILGNAAVLACAMAWSFALLRVRGHVWRMAPMQIMPFQTLLGGLLLLPFAAWFEGSVPRVARSWAFLLSFSYVSIAATFVAFWLVVEAARRLPAARMSLGQLATPVIGVAASALWLGERLSTGSVIGLALILLGVGVSAGFTPTQGARARERLP
jgi:drug/metabolite transporter (DMT)-like permease